jgi:hypothetical protein
MLNLPNLLEPVISTAVFLKEKGSRRGHEAKPILKSSSPRSRAAAFLDALLVLSIRKSHTYVIPFAVIMEILAYSITYLPWLAGSLRVLQE